MTPDAFVAQTLTQIRRDFYKGASSRQFFQEQPRLKEAIAYPARYLKDLGATKLALASYRRIIQTVLLTIKKHSGKIDRFEIYFLWCVQQHMKHHGEEYYEQAKAPRPISQVVPVVVGRLKTDESDHPIDSLAEAHRILSTNRRRRIQKGSKSSTLQPDFFTSASSLQNPHQHPKRSLKPLPHRPDSLFLPQTDSSPRSDS